VEACDEQPVQAISECGEQAGGGEQKQAPFAFFFERCRIRSRGGAVVMKIIRKR